MQTTNVHTLSAPAATTSPSEGWSDFMVGLILTALVPAVFWVAIFAAIANLVGYTPDFATLLMAGSAIAAFLGAFFAVLSARPN